MNDKDGSPAGGSDARTLSTGQLAAATGVSSRTIRYYEELGILPAPTRTGGGSRRYPPEYQFYIEGALALKEIGFSLGEVRLVGQVGLRRDLSERESEQLNEILRRRGSSLERRIRVLQLLREVLQNPAADAGRGYSEVIQAASACVDAGFDHVDG